MGRGGRGPSPAGLLNEVHDLISRHGDNYKFALSGSSARKLRRLDVNLLAGRVIVRAMFPLVAEELGSDFSVDAVLRFGSLPGIYSDEQYRVEKLGAYVHTYLRLEIQQEALVKDLGSFHLFKSVMAYLLYRDIIVAWQSDSLSGAYLTTWRNA